MPFYLVQPWGRDSYRQATVLGTHATGRSLRGPPADSDRSG